MLVSEMTIRQDEKSIMHYLSEAKRYNDYDDKFSITDTEIASFCMDFYHNNIEFLIANNKDLDLQTIEIMQFYIFSFSVILARFDILYPNLPNYRNFTELINLIKSAKANNLKIRLICNENAKETHVILVDFINKEFERI